MTSAYQNSVKIAHYSYHWFAILRVLLDKGRRSIIGCTSFPSKSSFLSLDISLFLCFVVERTYPFSTEMEKPLVSPLECWKWPFTDEMLLIRLHGFCGNEQVMTEVEWKRETGHCNQRECSSLLAMTLFVKGPSRPFLLLSRGFYPPLLILPGRRRFRCSYR